MLQEPSDVIDAAVFSSEILAPTEVLVKYLREKKFNKFSEIAKFLKRNQNTIQTTYKNAQTKYPKNITFRTSNINIPLSLFSTNKLTVFESLIKYLREKNNMTNNEIAKLLNRSNKTIWTVYERTKNKK